MSWEVFALAFLSILVAELGDKTQLAIVSLAASKRPAPVFLGASLALVMSTALAVAVGALLQCYLPKGATRFLNYAAGGLFILIGIWTLIRAG